MNVTPPQARYRQIANQLRSDIESGIYQPGEQLPSEQTLAERFGVSRPIINKAYELLESWGLLDVEHGRGTFVRRHRPIHHVSASYVTNDRDGERLVWSAALRKQGLNGSQRTTQVAAVDPPAYVSDKLLLPAGEQAWVRRRVMLLDNEPVQLADSYFPADIAAGTELADERLIRGGVVAALERLGHRPALKFDEQISARMPTIAEGEQLNMPPGVPVLVHTRVTYNAHGRPVEYDRHIMRSDRHVMDYELPVLP